MDDHTLYGFPPVNWIASSFTLIGISKWKLNVIASAYTLIRKYHLWIQLTGQIYPHGHNVTVAASKSEKLIKTSSSNKLDAIKWL